MVCLFRTLAASALLAGLAGRGGGGGAKSRNVQTQPACAEPAPVRTAVCRAGGEGCVESLERGLRADLCCPHHGRPELDGWELTEMMPSSTSTAHTGTCDSELVRERPAACRVVTGGAGAGAGSGEGQLVRMKPVNIGMWVGVPDLIIL